MKWACTAWLAMMAIAATAHAQTIDLPVGSGVVINHIPKSTGKFVGSPSIVKLDDGTLVASHDEFGPGSSQGTSAVSHVFRSTDDGATWTKTATLNDQFWSNLFVHNDALYLMGTTREYGRIVIRKSTDGGKTWTNPTDTSNGYLSDVDDARFHTAPMPVVVHNGRIWRGFENTPGGWGSFESLVISAPVDGDLLNKETWTRSNYLKSHTDWLPDDGFRGWLEGGVVVDREGQLVNILRIHRPEGQLEKAAIVRVEDENTINFDPQNDIINFPGGAKKFTIRYDDESDRYWTLVNLINADNFDANIPPSSIRNTVALMSSDDLENWDLHDIVMQDLSNTSKIGFQYIDWVIDGQDILAVSRTAYPDQFGDASNYHNANYLTFHHIENFRGTTPEPTSALPLVIGSGVALLKRPAASAPSHTSTRPSTSPE